MDTPDAATIDDIEARLDELQRESQERRAELRALAADLPQATSRRAVLASMVRSVRDAPDKPVVVKRVVLKVLRAPADIVRSLRS
jgi:cell division septum initiation protein DivIVA